MKTCSKCGSEGPFYPSNRSWCRKCVNEALTHWRRSNPEKTAAQGRRAHRKSRYNLTDAEWEKKFDAQGRQCRICHKPEPGTKGWATDHDHETGQVRDILCTLCNVGLGALKDSAVLLRAAAEYLDKWRGRDVGTTENVVHDASQRQDLSACGDVGDGI